MFPFAMW